MENLNDLLFYYGGGKLSKGLIYWIGLLLVAGGGGGWFLGKGFFESWRALSLDSQAKAEIISWQVEPISASKYTLKAEYCFKAVEKEYKGEALLHTTYFLNQYAAQREIERVKNRDWIVWYQAKNPSLSSLEKIVPLKQFVYGFLCLALFFYFLFYKRLDGFQKEV